MRKIIIFSLFCLIMVLTSSAAFAGTFSTELGPAPFDRKVAGRISDEFNKQAQYRLATAAEGTSRALIITGTMKDCFKQQGYSMDLTAREAFSQRDPQFWIKLRKTGMAHLLMAVIQNLQTPTGRKFMLDNDFSTQETIDAYDAHVKWAQKFGRN